MIFPSICEHGNNPALQPCYFCRIEHKANLLESRVKCLEEKISEKYAHPDVIGRLERLERYKSLVDSLSNHIENIKASVKVHWDDRSYFYKEINEIKQFQEINLEKIEKLEKEITATMMELKTEIDTIRALGARAYHPKKPHKCPVCSGQSIQDIKIVKTDSGLDKLVLECHACAGTGIIWG